MRVLSHACVVVLAVFAASAFAQTSGFPASVVDAQIPLVSSDGFSSPQGVAVAPGVVYVADTGKQRILSFPYGGSQAAVSLGSFGPVLLNPVGVAVDGAANLYVTDMDTNRLIKLRAPIGTLNALTVIGPEILDRPTAVAADVAGNLAVINSGTAKIVARRAGGAAAIFNTGTTTLVAPTALAFDNVGDLYVADAGNGTAPSSVYRFPKLGGNGVNLAPAGYDLKTITGIVLDDARNLFVLDGASKQLIEVPANGGAAFLVPQSNFFAPSGLAIDSIGSLYVADSANTVTKLVYNNAADFGAVNVGSTAAAVTFNYEFYQPTTIKARRGIGGGVWNAEYKPANGGTCSLRTYYPSTSGMGLTLPAACTSNFTFTPTAVNGRPGAVQVETSNGNVTQLAIGTGRGAQLAVLNAAVSSKLAGLGTSSMIVNSANTLLYFSGTGGTYQQPVGGGASKLLSTYTGKLGLNGAGDLYIFTGALIVRVPADGSAAVITNVSSIPGVKTPKTFTVDADGAIYIGDIGPLDQQGEFLERGFLLRVSSSGVVSTILRAGELVYPTNMTTDYTGNLYLIDGPRRHFLYLPARRSSGATAPGYDVTVGGSAGSSPDNLAADDTHTLYFWDGGDYGFGLSYVPLLTGSYPSFNFVPDQFTMPLYTVNGFATGIGNYVPFTVPIAEQAIALSPSGKMYIKNGDADNVFLVDRTRGVIPKEAFNPGFQYTGGPTQTFYLYNLGNVDATFTDPQHLFTESGNGVGAFSFSATSPGGQYNPPACVPGGKIPPAGVCQIQVTSRNVYGSGPTVTDTLRFLTDAVNNASVSFAISGAGSTAP